MLGHPLLGFFRYFRFILECVPQILEYFIWIFEHYFSFLKDKAIALAVTEVEHSALSTLLFCNCQDLLNGFTSDFEHFDVDRHEWKKQEQSINYEQAWMDMPKCLLKVLIFDFDF